MAFSIVLVIDLKSYPIEGDTRREMAESLKKQSSYSIVEAEVLIKKLADSTLIAKKHGPSWPR